jgi:uncharacterized protein (TIGR03086 family)
MSMSEPVEHLSRSLHQLSEILGNVRNDQGGAATPCSSWDVRTLASHVIADVDRYINTASGGQADWASGSPAVEGDWQVSFDHKSPTLIKTWRRLDDINTPMPSRMGEIPASFLVTQEVAEFVVHAWDLAEATGQHPVWDDEIAAEALNWAHQALKPEFRGDEASGKVFGLEQDAATGASTTEQLAAFFGRRLDWQT